MVWCGSHEHELFCRNDSQILQDNEDTVEQFGHLCGALGDSVLVLEVRLNTQYPQKHPQQLSRNFQTLQLLPRLLQHLDPSTDVVENDGIAAAFGALSSFDRGDRFAARIDAVSCAAVVVLPDVVRHRLKHFV